MQDRSRDTSEGEREANVLVLGAGPAGSAVAIGLVRRGVRNVLLIDKPSGLPFAIGESAAPTVRSQLSCLGLSADLEELGHSPYYGNLSLWGGTEPLVDDFLRRGTGHGYHLDRARFDAWLRESAVGAGAELLRPAELCSVESEGGCFRVEVRQQERIQSIRALVVVDATGRKAALVRRLGARVRHVDRLVAVCALFDPSPEQASEHLSLSGLSLVEPFSDGWFYAAGLPSGRVMVTVMTDDDLAREANLREPGALVDAIRASSHVRRAVRLSPPEPLTVMVTAASQYVDRAVGVGWIAVGDALMAFDPLTSSGIYGALDDAEAAAETVALWLEPQGGEAKMDAARAYSVRAESTLRRYLSERQALYGRESRWTERPFWRRRGAFERSPEER